MKVQPRLAIRVVFAAVAAILLLAGCGGSGTSSSSSQSPTPSPSPSPSKVPGYTALDACKLVTQDDASTALGPPVQNMGSAGACIYGKSDGSATLFVIGTVFADATAAQAANPDQIAASLNGAYAIANAHAVTGIGDKAVEYSVSGSGTNGLVIFVFKSNAVILIMLTPTTDSNKIETLARGAVNHLPAAT